MDYSPALGIGFRPPESSAILTDDPSCMAHTSTTLTRERRGVRERARERQRTARQRRSVLLATGGVQLALATLVAVRLLVVAPAVPADGPVSDGTRFGQFSGLQMSHSASDAVYPNTPTFSFVGAQYESSSLELGSVELQSNHRSGSSYTPLETPSAEHHSRCGCTTRRGRFDFAAST
jgi:hypothetical protein